MENIDNVLMYFKRVFWGERRERGEWKNKKKEGESRVSKEKKVLKWVKEDKEIWPVILGFFGDDTCADELKITIVYVIRGVC